eukprot:TRINITY_DN6133_c0_g1_i10.p2 TRINITY_DN6133_c0_g1~~TRINITY_DN6133_c0_g1_i10.p2  ORF type:complete len:173 (-),score=20.52 TRINITY_DN6133_c0_g1_i10:62-580(-)
MEALSPLASFRWSATNPYSTKVGTADEGVRLTSKDLDISHKHQTETVSCHDAAAVDCSRDCQLDELDVSCRHTELSMTFDGTASVEEGKPCELDVSCRLEEFEQAAPVADPVATCLDHSLDSEATTVSTASEELQGIERLRLAYKRLRAECDAACRNAVQVTRTSASTLPGR